MKLFKSETQKTVTFIIISSICLFMSLIQSVDELLHFNLSWVAIILCGLPIIKEAATCLYEEFDIKADVLVSLALIASVIIGEIFAAGEISVIMTIGALLEDLTVQKAKSGIENLVKLTPKQARIIRDNKEIMINADDIEIGDIVRVIVGETIPVDGVIIKGQGSIDESIMNGESLPVDKYVGDDVLSGTINQYSTFDIKATKTSQDSSLKRMIKLVKEGDSKKAPIVSLTDRWATWIVVIALVSSIGTYLVTHQILRLVTILVVFCPCALVLATPTAIMASIGNASKYGMLIKGGDVVERLSKIKNIPYLLYLSKKTMKTIKLNVIFSLALNFLAIILAMTGILNPVVGALVHNLGSVFVILNSAKLLKTRNNLDLHIKIEYEVTNKSKGALIV